MRFDPVSAVIIVLAAGVGAAAGSFCSTAALRFAAGHDVGFGRSRCDGCARTLGWTETVPFAGFLINRGKCRTCGSAIDAFHLWGEGGGAIIAVSAVVLSPDTEGVLLAFIGLVLLAQSLIDIKTYRLPDLGNGLVAIMCLGLALLNGQFIVGLVAAVAATVLLYGLKYWLEHRRRQTMLGSGDIKLVAALALALGVSTPYMLALASFLGLIAIGFGLRRESHQRLPFGPCIALSGFGFLLAGPVVERLS
jgi:leader peptidase (prepilin peptidase)/N-methyltransferase